MKRLLHGTLRLKNSPTDGWTYKSRNNSLMWPTIVLSLFFPCRNFCAENFVIFFYEIKLLFTYLFTLDWASSYWQIEATPHDRTKATFILPSGLNTLPMGLANATATCQQAIQDLMLSFCLAYLDDAVVLAVPKRNSWTTSERPSPAVKKLGLR